VIAMRAVRAERDYEHWLFNSIKNIFRVCGFRISGFFPTQRQEHRLPFDVAHWIEMGDLVKVVGFQVKTLYYDGDIFGSIDENRLFYMINTSQLAYIADNNENAKTHRKAGGLKHRRAVDSTQIETTAK